MKIGIMTFHWATNYGAILQAYALQRFLMGKYSDAKVEIINYKPKRYDIRFFDFLNILHPRKVVYTYGEHKRENKIKFFRNEQLKLTHRFYSEAELAVSCDDYDILISGSDQIWNSYYTSSGENGLTLAYYLSFGRADCRRIAYAASFGCDIYPQELVSVIKPYLERYNRLGVRENSAIKILCNMGIYNAELNADPTLLLEKWDYLSLIETSGPQNEYIAAYFLRDNASNVRDKINNCRNAKIIDCSVRVIGDKTIGGWLQMIHDCKVLLTNSYHGMLFAIIFNKDFYVFLEKRNNIGMNDRIITLLSIAGLQDRIIDGNKICPALSTDWEEVNRKLKDYREKAKKYLNDAILGTA